MANETVTNQGRPRTELHTSSFRQWLPLLGILLLLLGAFAIVFAFAATLITVLVLGILLLVGGVGEVFHAFQVRSTGTFLLHAALGLLYLLVGALLVVDPVEGAIGLTLLVALFFLFMGALRIAGSFRRWSYQPTGWLLAGGILDLLLGVVILAGWPFSGLWVIGLFVGIELIFSGCLLLLFPGQMGGVV